MLSQRKVVACGSLLVGLALAGFVAVAAGDFEIDSGGSYAGGEPWIVPAPVDATLDALARTTDPMERAAILDEAAGKDARRLRAALDLAGRTNPKGGTVSAPPLVFVLTEVVRSGLEEEARAGALARLSEIEATRTYREAGREPRPAEVVAFQAEWMRQLLRALPSALESEGSRLRGIALRTLEAHPAARPLPAAELAHVALTDPTREWRMSALEILARDGSDLSWNTLLVARTDEDEVISALAEELLDEN